MFSTTYSVLRTSYLFHVIIHPMFIIEKLQHIWFYLMNPDVWYYTFFYQKSYFEVLYNILIVHWVWIPLVWFMFFHMFLEVYLDIIRDKYKHHQKFILLAIDVPKKNIQSIYAVEQIFVQILGAHTTFNWWETYIEGLIQLQVNFEIVAIDGYIQFLIHCPEAWRDLIEGAVYGQYPDAEITQVEDYVNGVPHNYPDDTWDMWGVEWSFDNKENPYMPIKTYSEFEDKYSEDTKFVDPLAGLLEAMSRTGKGEQIWFQICTKPAGVDWAKAADEKIGKLIGREEKPHKKSTLQTIMGVPMEAFDSVTEQLMDFRLLTGSHDPEKKEDTFGKMWKMSPGERTTLEAMERKIGKLGYFVKMRFGYFAEKKVMNKARGVQAVIGAVKQFNAIGRQGFKPELKKTATKAAYFMIKKRKAYRQRKMTEALYKRSMTLGMPKMKMSTEELATLFHFPSMLIKSPMLKKTELIKSSAPTNLPFEDVIYEESQSEAEVGKASNAATESVLAGLPFADEHAHAPEIPQVSFDYDSEYFEKKFAVDKKAFEAHIPEREAKLKKIEDAEAAKAEISQLAVVEPEVEKPIEVIPEHPGEKVVEITRPGISAEELNAIFSSTYPPEPEPVTEAKSTPSIEPPALQSEPRTPNPELPTPPIEHRTSNIVQPTSPIVHPTPNINPPEIQHKVDIIDFFAGHETGHGHKKNHEDDEPPTGLPYV